MLVGVRPGCISVGSALRLEGIEEVEVVVGGASHGAVRVGIWERRSVKDGSEATLIFEYEWMYQSLNHTQ